MNFGERVRNIGFNIISRMRKDNIVNHLNHIKKLNSNTTLLETHAEDKVNKLIEHSKKTTSYYKNYMNAEHLRDFPVLTKKDIVENYNDIFSLDYDREKLFSVQTSGSTGSPMEFYFNKDKRARQLAEVAYYGELSQFKIGTKHAYVRSIKKSNPIKNWIQNQIVMNPNNLNERWLEENRNILKTEKVKVLFGHPTALRVFASYCAEEGDNKSDFYLKSVISFAEVLTDETRKLLKNTFCENVYNRYSTSESGVLAQECVLGNFHINKASYIIELFDLYHDKPVGFGELGRIVVTDLYSYSMPLIRYDIGDLGILKKECECGVKGIVLEKIEGRMIELITNSRGDQLSPLVISNVMKEIENVIQFQFSQFPDSKYIMKLVVDKDFNSSFQIEKKLINVLGSGATIKLEYVDDIPSSKSGKRPYIINKT